MKRGRSLPVAVEVLALFVLLGYGCGDRTCDTGEPDGGDTAAEPDTAGDPDVPDLEEQDAADITDVIDEDADADSAEAPPPVDCSRIEEHMTQDGLLVHLEALETVATDSGGSRVAGSAGWDGTIDYVEDRLEEYGYTPARMDTTYSYFEEETDPVLQMISPSSHVYAFSPDDWVTMTGDFQRMHLSRPGDVSASVTAVDLELGPGNASTSGCEPSDFAGFPAGNIALIQRGTCPFVTKANNADDAGAGAIIIFNQGNTVDRTGLFIGGVGLVSLDPEEPEHGVGIPVVFATYAVGEGIATLLASGPVVMRLQVSDVFEVRTSQNILADTAGGDPEDIVVYGAHLDSEVDCPGMNDDATGIAAVLEIARLVAECEPARKFRFGFWATEEWGWPWGSVQYVASLSDTELARISMYFNIDMIGSSNHAFFVYDGDGSDFWVPGPEGSAELEWFFVADLMLHGYPSVPLWGGSSDHIAFYMNDIAYGWLFTGGALQGAAKTEEEAALFGGTAGEAYHPCQHEACDTIENLNMDVAEIAAKSYARSAQFFGLDGLSVILP